jgi:hypothetical protein
MAAKPQQTLGDYVTIALSPLLIMALVGSLVFFLLDILYVGQYAGRLQWTLFFFVFGIVLIARISIEQSNARAMLFGLALGAVVFIALQTFVEYPAGSIGASFGWAINLGLMALSWWCAHRLTWDCTYIDDTVDASGKGVLEAAGLDEQAEDRESKMEDSEDESMESSSPGLLGWLDRYRRYREQQLRKPHTPGVWIVYFSLAALPLYGLGQAVIPAAAADRRRYAFWLMVCYVASGLGLLLTTSYLGLRRYLRQRKLRMPLAMTRVWLVLGGTLVVGMMVVGALLPRPYAEYQISFTRGGSKDLKAGPYALKHDGAGKGEGQPSSDPTRSDDTAADGQGKQRDDKSNAETQGDSKSAGKGSSGSGKQGSSKSESEKGKDDEQQRDQQSGEQSKDEKSQQDADKNNDQDGKQKGKASNPAAKDDPRKNQDDQKSGRGKSPPPPSSSPPPLLPSLSALATVLKWIVFAILALAVLFLLLRSGLKFLANFTNWARQLLAALDAWWQNLFGRKKPEAEPVTAEQTQARKRPRPFSSFDNPFRDGTAAHLSPDEIATYSFEALQSWAWERGLGREPEETPLEFAERLTSEVPALETEVRGLAGMYARVAYARGRLATGTLKMLSQFWERLEAVDERPLSA